MGNLLGCEDSDHRCVSVSCCVTGAAPSPGYVHVAATPVLHVMGLAAYHTSVILDDREYFFSPYGIECCDPLYSHQDDRYETETFYCGRTLLTGPLLIKYLTPYFAGGSYDILSKNCNSFSDAALYFLNRTRLDARFNRLERMMQTARPASIGVTKVLIQAFFSDHPLGGGAEDVMPWVDNPLAKHFSVEEVVATCDAFDEEATQQLDFQAPRTEPWSCPALCADNMVLEDVPDFKKMARQVGHPTASHDEGLPTIALPASEPIQVSF